MINELGKKCNLRVIRVLHLFILRNIDKTKNLSEVVHKLLFDIIVIDSLEILVQRATFGTI